MKEPVWLLACVLMGTSLVFARRPLDVALLLHLLNVALLFSALTFHGRDVAVSAVAAAVLGVHPFATSASRAELFIAAGTLAAAFPLPLLLIATGALILPFVFGVQPGIALLLPRDVGAGAYLPVLGLALLSGALLRPAATKSFTFIVLTLAFVTIAHEIVPH